MKKQITVIGPCYSLTDFETTLHDLTNALHDDNQELIDVKYCTVYDRDRTVEYSAIVIYEAIHSIHQELYPTNNLNNDMRSIRSSNGTDIKITSVNETLVFVTYKIYQ